MQPPEERVPVPAEAVIQTPIWGEPAHPAAQANSSTSHIAHTASARGRGSSAARPGPKRSLAGVVDMARLDSVASQLQLTPGFMPPSHSHNLAAGDLGRVDSLASQAASRGLTWPQPMPDRMAPHALLATSMLGDIPPPAPLRATYAVPTLLPALSQALSTGPTQAHLRLGSLLGHVGHGRCNVRCCRGNGTRRCGLRRRPGSGQI